MDDPSLIRLFSDLTGESDGAGRNVLMYLDMLAGDYYPNRNQNGAGPNPKSDLAPGKETASPQQPRD